MMEKERQRLMTMIEFDVALGQGQRLFGMDEVGRGPLAGPVVAACVCLDPSVLIEGVRDSKRVAPRKRERVAQEIKRQAIAYGIGEAGVEEIETLNILGATKLAMRRAYDAMGMMEGLLLIDAIDPRDLGVLGHGVIKGDDKSYCIAAASLLAKTHRDALMVEIEKTYPQYGFGQHKGYGTAEHMQAIRAHGPCEWHRPSFLRNIL